MPCPSQSIISEPYDEWLTKNARPYNLVKEIFGGECVLEKVCSNCGNIASTLNKFECLKVSYEGSQEGSFKGMLYKLIEEALNWRNSHQISV